MHRRALEAGVSQYEILIDNEHYPIEDIVTAAEAASRPDSDLLMGGADPILDFWAVQQRIIRGEANDEALGFLREKLASDNPTVRATSAEALARLGKTEWAIPVFRELLALEEPNLRLYVARSLAVSMTNAQALEAEIRATRQAMLAPPGSRRPWKDFVYSAFTSWALEWALVKSGLNEWDDFKGL